MRQLGNQLFHYSVSSHSALRPLSKHSSNWWRCVLHNVYAHVSQHTSMCALLQRALPQNLPVLCIFSAKPISRLLRLSYCFPSVVIIHLLLHYWLFMETELLVEEMELASLRPQWQWHMLTLHKSTITCYTCRPLPHLAERSSRRWLRWQFPEGGSDR